MKAPDKVKRLVEVFDRNLEAYKSSGYKEANVRSEFIDPFFEALGWDVYNRQGYAEAYKDVITEDAIKVGGVTKAPDYCFRVGGARKFFVEAKKPSVDIKGDVSPAYQLRRYAWSAGLPLSILTDFEEFAVYDCRIRPQLKDKSGKARVIYLTYRDYIDKWEEISSIFSKKAVLEGFFDKYVDSKKKRSTQEVDAEFLKEIEDWRLLLARNIALRNPTLGIREINFAVQRTIDRIIFLRICEDRGVETYGQLQALLNGANTYDRLRKIFQVADEKYNSGLFHFRQEKDLITPPDELTLSLKIDDRVLKEIFKQLYYPESPYEFSVLGADILGHIYEQFLGKVIKLTKGHQAKVEEKPEVRKAGGVYYTPTYIVDYIVKNTVGKLCEGKPPKKIENLRILDPACGSGSFLIGAYNYLNDYHRDWYLENLIPQLGHEGYISMMALRKYVPGKKPEMPIYQGKGGQWYLTTREKKRILLNNIYGVDIDSQAVEVTKLSLLLKVLENENQDTLERQMKLWRERALPDLGNNIKCGNSLIGPDFYEGEQLTLLDDEEQYRINVFDWTAEFPEIMEKGGFDAVIGNPPYIRMEEFKEFKTYFRTKYQTHSDRADIYFYFVEKATTVLKNGGKFSFILSNTFTRSRAGRSLRLFISTNLNLVTLLEFGDFTPFVGATVYPIIVVAEKSGEIMEKVTFSLQDSDPVTVPIEKQFPTIFLLERSSFGEKEWIFENPKSTLLRSRLLSQFPSLQEKYGDVCRGIVSGLNEAFIISDADRKKIVVSNPEAKAIIKPYIGGKNIGHYHCQWDNKWIIYTPHGISMNLYPMVIKHLRPYKSKLEKRATKQAWYELQQPQEAYVDLFEKPKIIYPDISSFPKFSLDVEQLYFSNTAYFIPSGSIYLLGLLNSKLLWFVIRGLSNALRGGLWRFRLFSGNIERLPIRAIDFSNLSDKAAHDQMVVLSKRMLDLNNQLTKAKTPDEKTRIGRQIKATDNQIDQLVYELYGLTEKEIIIVEEESKV